MLPVEFNGRKFSFSIPTPITGSLIFNFIVSYRLPFGMGEVYNFGEQKEMNITQIEEYMKLCLQNCWEELGEHKAQVIDTEGNPSVQDAQGPLLTFLVNRFIAFFIQWWFGEIASLLSPEPPDTSQPNPQT